MNIHYFGSIEGVVKVEQHFEIVHLMVDISFDLNKKKKYEKRETSSGDEISFEGDVLILIFL